MTAPNQGARAADSVDPAQGSLPDYDDRADHAELLAKYVSEQFLPPVQDLLPFDDERRKLIVDAWAADAALSYEHPPFTPGAGNLEFELRKQAAMAKDERQRRLPAALTGFVLASPYGAVSVEMAAAVFSVSAEDIELLTELPLDTPLETVVDEAGRKYLVLSWPLRQMGLRGWIAQWIAPGPESIESLREKIDRVRREHAAKQISRYEGDYLGALERRLDDLEAQMVAGREQQQEKEQPCQ